ncbi:hypothetical protein FOA43_003840 [Brettanomyces nanus]|uniref:Uncharacterized protein n=1 Tax=Eeniella nana TaxID=13502 RepID=A0A875S476_EENNA|nr:uncharacterized protein FOA43_003840 [Brettanomyces nanus]QPG76451.1 hypothetical protein FOA43_003840 [Brettanomyces nanus]
MSEPAEELRVHKIRGTHADGGIELAISSAHSQSPTDSSGRKKFALGLRKISDRLRRKVSSSQLSSPITVDDNDDKHRLSSSSRSNYPYGMKEKVSPLIIGSSNVVPSLWSDSNAPVLSSNVTMLGLGLAGRGLHKENNLESLDPHTFNRNLTPPGSLESLEQMPRPITNKASLPSPAAGMFNFQAKSHTPVYFIKKIMNNHMTIRNYRSLEKILRNSKDNKEWIRQFVDIQGHMALAVVLLQISQRTIKSNDQLDKEFTILAAIRNIMNFQEKEDGRIHLSEVNKYVVPSLMSPRIITRNTATGMLALSVAYEKKQATESIIKGLLSATESLEMDSTSDLYSSTSSVQQENPFKDWMSSAEELVADFESENPHLVFSDQDFVKGRLTPQSIIKEYALLTIFLLSSLVSTYSDALLRVTVRQKLEDAGLIRLFDFAKSLRSEAINDLVGNYLSYRNYDIDDTSSFKEKPEEEVTENEDRNRKDDDLGNHDSLEKLGLNDEDLEVSYPSSNDPLVAPFITSMLKNLAYLTHLTDKKERLKYFRVIDNLVENVVHINNISDQNILFSTQLLLDRLNTDDTARMAVSEARESARLLREYGQRIHQLEDELKSASSLSGTSKFDHSNDTSSLNKISEGVEQRRLSSAATTGSRSNPELQNGYHRISQTGDDPMISNNFSASKFFEPYDHYQMNILDNSPKSDSSSDMKVEDSINNLCSKEAAYRTARSFVSVASTTPQAPPLPAFLKQTNKETAIPSVSSSSVPSPPVPPPPPSFLTSMSKKIDNSPLPPPLPEFLSKSQGRSQPTLLTPPLAPPLPPHNAKKAKLVSQVSTLSDEIENVTSQKVSKVLAMRRPTSKMKHLHLDKVQDISPTFWSKADDEKIISLLDKTGVLSDVEATFKALDTPIRVYRAKVKDDSSTKMSFLPRELQQQFGINLHQYSNLSEIRFVSKVLSCDKSLLDNTTVIEFFNWDGLMNIGSSIMNKFVPYSTNVRMKELKPKSDPNDLDRFDRIYLELCINLKNYWPARSKALLLSSTYERDYHDMLKKLNLIDRAVSSIKNSESLLQVFNIIKNIANYMNDSSKLVLGFKISSLQRLRFMKNSKNTISLLHYIEKIIRVHFPDLTVFVDELKELQKVSGVSLSTLEAEVSEYKSTVSNCDQSFTTGSLSDKSKLHSQDRILEYMKPILSKAKRNAELLKSHSESTVKDFDALMMYFGENPSDKANKESFFGIFSSFTESYKKVHIENVRAEEEAKAFEVRKKMMEDFKNKRAKDKEETHGSSESATEAIQGLLSQLKSNHPLTRKYSQYRDKKVLYHDTDTLTSKAQMMLKDLEKNQVAEDVATINDISKGDMESVSAFDPYLNSDENGMKSESSIDCSSVKSAGRLSIITMLINGPAGDEFDALSGEEDEIEKANQSIDDVIQNEEETNKKEEGNLLPLKRNHNTLSEPTKPIQVQSEGSSDSLDIAINQVISRLEKS